MKALVLDSASPPIHFAHPPAGGRGNGQKMVGAGTGSAKRVMTPNPICTPRFAATGNGRWLAGCGVFA